jgi:tetratricopeptide (TPR) repeat protein
VFSPIEHLFRVSQIHSGIRRQGPGSAPYRTLQVKRDSEFLINSQPPRTTRAGSLLRSRAILAVCSILVVSAVGWGDTLRFKNGTYIQVDRAVENGDQVDYWLGSTKYSIPRLEIEKIEKNSGPSISLGSQSTVNIVPPSTVDQAFSISGSVVERTPVSASHAKVAVPTPATPQDQAYWTALRARISIGDHVDEGALAAIEKQGNAAQTANAYFAAGLFQVEHNAAQDASTYFERATNLAPNAGWLLAWYAMALAQEGNSAEAAAQAERMTRLEPQSVAAFRLLGALQYNADQTRNAVGAWKRAQELEPDTATAERLERAQRELELEDRQNLKESRHFSLRYEGAKTPLALEQSLLGTLEEQFDQLTQALNFHPAENIVVILYTQREFFDVTQAPAWAGGINDGKLRIPIQGINTMTPALQHVLKHELTHSFVRFMVRDRCPSWLNEGLAQMLEPRSSSPYALMLAHLFAQQKEIPFRALEAPFNDLSPLQAEFAYAESLALVQFLTARYGMEDVLRVLHRIGEEEAPEAALRSVTQSSYEELQRQVADYLAKGGVR